MKKKFRKTQMYIINGFLTNGSKNSTGERIVFSANYSGKKRCYLYKNRVDLNVKFTQYTN